MILEGVLLANVLHSIMWYDYTEKGFQFTKGGSNMQKPEETNEVVSNELELEIEEIEEMIAPGAMLSD